MNKKEEKIIKKYKNKISTLIRHKYKKISEQEAKQKKIYLENSEYNKKSLNDLKKEIYATYSDIIEEEIKIKVEEYINSDRFKQTLKAEEKISKRKLSYKSLKQYQEFNLNIPKYFLDELYKEVNKNISEPGITVEEIKYILLLTMYKMIDCLKNGFKIKIGTICHIWFEKRDMRINLPNIKDRILENRLVPKIKLCKSFDYELFKEINKDNQAILNYYKQKIERWLILLKIKNGNKENAND